jgi:serine/threonine protein kinase/NACalpha-BTF3-like transcription factor
MMGSGIPDGDVELVAERTGATEDRARRALEQGNRDLATAVELIESGEVEEKSFRERVEEIREQREPAEEPPDDSAATVAELLDVPEGRARQALDRADGDLAAATERLVSSDADSEPRVAPSERRGEEPSGRGSAAPPDPGESDIRGTDAARSGPVTSGDGDGSEFPRAPETIPGAPEVTVEHDTLSDEEPIGAGGNADVVLTWLPTADGAVPLAVKRLRMNGTVRTETVERLLEEAETWDRLDDHDHVVGVVDYGSEPLPWLAMEYMDGGHLGERAGDMGLDQALWTAVAVTRAVRHAHRRGVAHLDLKPENVLFREVEGAWDAPKVADWGLSKHLLEHSKSVEGLSPGYAAPEQFDEGFGNADDLTDVYGLGAVFYELFTGRPPFEGKPARAMRKVLTEDPTPPSEVADVPPVLDDILLTALAKEKANRYESVLYLRDDLQALYQGA